jgi:phage repressor protein C with HTH and peptisase S24 domain
MGRRSEVDHDTLAAQRVDDAQGDATESTGRLSQEESLKCKLSKRRAERMLKRAEAHSRSEEWRASGNGAEKASAASRRSHLEEHTLPRHQEFNVRNETRRRHGDYDAPPTQRGLHRSVAAQNSERRMQTSGPSATLPPTALAQSSHRWISEAALPPPSVLDAAQPGTPSVVRCEEPFTRMESAPSADELIEGAPSKVIESLGEQRPRLFEEVDEPTSPSEADEQLAEDEGSSRLFLALSTRSPAATCASRSPALLSEDPVQERRGSIVRL